MARAKTVAEVIAGEAVSGSPEERIADMRAIASVIANRAALLGVTPQEVIANSREFNAYNKALPPGVDQSLIDMAQEQVDYVAENGPTNNATFYATPAAADNLPGGLSYETETTGHQYFSDPQMRSIGTSNGYVQPNQYAYAQNVANVPTPFAPTDLSNGSLLSAFQPNPQSEDPFASILGGQKPAPVDVNATGLLGGVPAQEAQTRAVPMMSVPATADLGTTPGMDASATAGLLGPSTAGFDASRFDGAAPSVASDFDQGRFADQPTAAFDPSRFGPSSISPATNVASFADQPTAPADLGGFASAMAAQRGAPTGLLSADAQTVQGLAEKQLAEAAMNQPALSVPAGGILAGNSPLAAQATVPSLTAYTAPTATTPAEQAIDSITTGATPQQQATGYGLLSPAPGLTNLSGGSLFDVDLSGNVVAATPYTPTQTQSLDAVDAVDQPSVASFDGPTDTPVVEQQKTQVTTQAMNRAVAPQPTVEAAQNTKSFKDSLFSKETALGGILGGVLGGPVGGILGGLAGQQVSRGGGLTGLLGGGFAAPTNQIAGGVNNIGGIYDGRYAPGTFAVANNGAQITAQDRGYTSYTTPSGQNETISPTGQISHNFGSLF